LKNSPGHLIHFMRLKRVEKALAPTSHGQSHVSVHDEADEKSD
jgi:hypothetical protein